MGLLKSATDLVFTIRFLKLLVTPFEKLGAYKAGIIDKNGVKNKDFSLNNVDDREAYRTHYTPFIRLVINLKRLMAKAPGGQSVIARYGAALLLIKEHGGDIDKIHAQTGIDALELIESTSKWFVLEDNALGVGVYHMLNDTVTTEVEDIVKKDDKVRVIETMEYPVDNILGVDIYKVKHLRSGQFVYISTGEISR